MPPTTPLGEFAFYCSPGALRAALLAGADPNATDGYEELTPLMWLCEMHDRHTRARKRMFRLLLEAGASMTASNIHGDMACHYAKRCSSRTFYRFVRHQYERKLGHFPKPDAPREKSAYFGRIAHG